MPDIKTTTTDEATEQPRPWGVHALGDIYHPGVQAGLPDGSWAHAVGEPYTANRLRAAWWVLTGRAYALRWPKAGDLEAALAQARGDQ